MSMETGDKQKSCEGHSGLSGRTRMIGNVVGRRAEEEEKKQ